MARADDRSSLKIIEHVRNTLLYIRKNDSSLYECRSTVPISERGVRRKDVADPIAEGDIKYELC